MKIAGVQLDVRFGDLESNQARILKYVAETASAGASLTVFPECALTGYCCESVEEAHSLAQPIPGPFTEQLLQTCDRLQTYVVCGMIERAENRLFNAAVLVGPRGLVASYRKIHLPYLGVDRFVAYGDRPFATHEVGEIRVGMNICYDGSFPESARCLTLLGADLIVLPTNWPPGAECVAQCLASCRALENRVYFLAVNRIGTERNFSFIGQSQVCDPSGNTLYLASADKEEVFFADIDPTIARRKHVVRVPDEHEIDRLADRRPEFYSPMVEPHARQSPGRERDLNQ